MYEILPQSSDSVVGMRVSETLTRADLDGIAADLKRFLQDEQRLNALILMEDFHGWESASAALRDLQIDSFANKHLDRIAMVGEHEWQEWMSWFSKAFVKGELKYFDRERLADAWQWAHGDA